MSSDISISEEDGPLPRDELLESLIRVPQDLSVLHVLDHRPKIMFSGDMGCHDSIRIPSLAYFAGKGSAALDNPPERLPKRTLEVDSFPKCNSGDHGLEKKRR